MPNLSKATIPLLLVTFVFVAIPPATAQVYKCKGADGKLQFADRPCPSSTPGEVVPDKWGQVSEQQRREALQRFAREQNEASAIDSSRATQREQAARQAQTNAAAAEGTSAASSSARADQEAMNNCIKDVERRGASEKVKAEMMAACRSAGAQQRASGSSSLVSDCVKNVERSGASEKDKARQIARCHGGDVQPEPIESPKKAQFCTHTGGGTLFCY